MRIALLSALNTDNLGPALAGKSVLRLQAEFAIALGCQRFFVMAPQPSQDVFRLQSFCEEAGCKFQLIRDAKPLLAGVKSEDQMLVIDQDILPLSDRAAQTLKEAPAILALDADNAEVETYERIDMNRRWAGALIIPGRLIPQLEEMPPDAAIPSTLLRLALQARVPIKLLSDKETLAGRWSNGHQTAVALVLEDNPETTVPNFSVSQWIADRIHSAVQPLLSRHSITAKHIAAATGIVAIVGVATSLASPLAAFGIVGLAWSTAQLIRSDERFTQTPFSQETKSRFPIASLFVDFGLLLSLGIAHFASDAPRNWPPAVFGAVALIASLRIGQNVIFPKTSGLLTDRLLVCLLLVGIVPFVGLENAVFAIAGPLLAISAFSIERGKASEAPDKDNHELTQVD